MVDHQTMSDDVWSSNIFRLACQKSNRRCLDDIIASLPNRRVLDNGLHSY